MTTLRDQQPQQPQRLRRQKDQTISEAPSRYRSQSNGKSETQISSAQRNATIMAEVKQAREQGKPTELDEIIRRLQKSTVRVEAPDRPSPRRSGASSVSTLSSDHKANGNAVATAGCNNAKNSLVDKIGDDGDTTVETTPTIKVSNVAASIAPNKERVKKPRSPVASRSPVTPPTDRNEFYVTKYLPAWAASLVVNPSSYVTTSGSSSSGSLHRKKRGDQEVGREATEQQTPIATLVRQRNRDLLSLSTSTASSSSCSSSSRSSLSPRKWKKRQQQQQRRRPATTSPIERKKKKRPTGSQASSSSSHSSPILSFISQQFECCLSDQHTSIMGVPITKTTIDDQYSSSTASPRPQQDAIFLDSLRSSYDQKKKWFSTRDSVERTNEEEDESDSDDSDHEDSNLVPVERGRSRTTRPATSSRSPRLTS